MECLVANRGPPCNPKHRGWPLACITLNTSSCPAGLMVYCSSTRPARAACKCRAAARLQGGRAQHGAGAAGTVGCRGLQGVGGPCSPKTPTHPAAGPARRCRRASGRAPAPGPPPAARRAACPCVGERRAGRGGVGIHEPPWGRQRGAQLPPPAARCASSAIAHCHACHRHAVAAPPPPPPPCPPAAHARLPPRRKALAQREVPHLVGGRGGGRGEVHVWRQARQALGKGRGAQGLCPAAARLCAHIKRLAAECWRVHRRGEAVLEQGAPRPHAASPGPSPSPSPSLSPWSEHSPPTRG